MQLQRDKYRAMALETKGFRDTAVPTVHPCPDPIAWRVVFIHKLTGDENQGSHNVYVDLLGSDGNFFTTPDIRLCHSWDGRGADEPVQPASFDKPAGEPGSNVVISKGTMVEVWICDPRYGSDKVRNLHTSLPDDGEGNHTGHHSYYLIFALGEASSEVEKEESSEIPGGEILVPVRQVYDALEALRITMVDYIGSVGRVDPRFAQRSDEILNAFNSRIKELRDRFSQQSDSKP